jgi:dolichyldiphosphatase
VLCSGLAKILKLIIKEPRPGLSSQQQPAQSLWKSITTGLLKTDMYGMPSSHSQATSYFSTYLSLLLWKENAQTWKTGYLTAIVLLNSLTFAIMKSRVTLGLHTTKQTIAGASIGALFAYAWYDLWENRIVEEGLNWWLEKWTNAAASAFK